MSLTTALSTPPSACTSISSVSSRSIVIVATSRKNRTRAPLAETSKFSATPAPLKSKVSVSAWPSTTSLPSPGSQRNESLPAPRKPVSSPRLPSTASSPSPPSSTSLPSPPLIVSLPAPPSIPSLIRAASPTAPEIVSLPSSPFTFRTSLAASECSIFSAAASPVTSTAPALGAMLTVSLPAVPLTVVVSTAPSPAPPPIAVSRSSSMFLTSVADRSFTTVLSMPPSARRSTRSVSSTSMVMFATLRKSFRRLPFAEKSKFSATTGAVEDQRVGAGLPFHLVAPVTGIPCERVVAGAEETGVVSAVAVDRVVLGAAAQRVVAVAAVDRVVARSAVQRQLGQRCEPDCAVERVVPGQGLDSERLGVDDVDRQAVRPARDGDVRCDCSRSDTDRVVSGRALDDDAVDARAGIEVQLVVRGLGA